MKKYFAYILLGVIICLFILPGCTEDQTDATNEDQNQETSNEDITEKEKEEPPTDSNLLLHWAFDEVSGESVSDAVGSYIGTTFGDPVWVAGKIDNALEFDGVDDYIKLPQSAIDDLGDLTQGTIALWFKYTSLLDTQTIMPILFIGNQNPSDPDSIFIIELGHSDTEAETLTADPANKNLYVTWTDWVQDNMEPILCYDTNLDIVEDTWYHFALVVGSDGNTGYLDGIELESRRYNFGTASDQLFLSEIPVKELFTIGYGKTHRQISPEFLYFKGVIDDLRIYNTPLSEGEIQDLLI